MKQTVPADLTLKHSQSKGKNKLRQIQLPKPEIFKS